MKSIHSETLKRESADMGIGKPFRTLMLSIIHGAPARMRYAVMVMEDGKFLFDKSYEKKSWAVAMYNRLSLQLYRERLEPYRKNTGKRKKRR